jgi:hypothetical protein
VTAAAAVPHVSRAPLLAARAVLALAVVATAALSQAAPVAAAEYTLETTARYDVRPAERRVDVEVAVTFTNTTPDPEGQFSVFDSVKLAVHDEAVNISAADDAGALEVSLGRESDVNVATVTLRDGLRFQESASFRVAYQLPDGGAGLRVRPSAVVFPAWGFGTRSDVTVTLPAGYEVGIDGDAMTAQPNGGGTLLTSGPISDPTRWLSVVTAAGAAPFTTFTATVPLTGGTADLQVRAFSDDEAWGERTRDIIVRALPLLEERIGVPYPHVGPLVITESVGIAGGGLAEEELAAGEILVAFDQPAFTALHQLAHVWLGEEFVAERWIAEGLASYLAAAVAAELGLDPPYDPAARAAELAAAAPPEGQAPAAFALAAWPDRPTSQQARYGYAASWAFMNEVAASAGTDAMPTVLQRTAAGLDPTTPSDELPAAAASLADQALTSRSLLDHLETVSGIDLADRFAAAVLVPADIALLDARRASRAAYADLVVAAADWGPPDPVRAALRAWDFELADERTTAARGWLVQRDALIAAIDAAGLATPDRLRDTYRTDGGGPSAQAELAAEEAVVDAYIATLAATNTERGLLARLGLLGGPDPAHQLAVANGRFAGGDLAGAMEAIDDANQLIDSAAGAGAVRLLSALVVILLALGAAVLLVRRRRYTQCR